MSGVQQAGLGSWWSGMKAVRGVESFLCLTDSVAPMHTARREVGSTYAMYHRGAVEVLLTQRLDSGGMLPSPVVFQNSRSLCLSLSQLLDSRRRW